jgi:hypothetical protein
LDANNYLDRIKRLDPGTKIEIIGPGWPVRLSLGTLGNGVPYCRARIMPDGTVMLVNVNELVPN